MGDEHNFLAGMIDPGGARAKRGVGYFDEVDAEAMVEEYEEAAATAGRLIAEVAELRRTVVGMGVMMKAVGEQRDEWKRRAEAAEARLENLRPHPEDEAYVVSKIERGLSSVQRGDVVTEAEMREHFTRRAQAAASKIQPMPESLKAVEAEHAGEPDVSGRAKPSNPFPASAYAPGKLWKIGKREP